MQNTTRARSSKQQQQKNTSKKLSEASAQLE